jgi:GTP-binding protein Era
MRYGTVAIVGRTNVGKSTFLNAALGQPLAIISNQPQTTRETLLGVVTSPEAQLAFIDTPGLHRPKTELGRRMNNVAQGSLRDADVALFITDVFAMKSALTEAESKGGDDDASLIERIPADLPAVVAINKIDKVRRKEELLPFMEALNRRRSFQATVPISALKGDGVPLVLAALIELLPEGPAHFAADTLTDRPLSYFAREYVREQICQITSQEVPHSCAVTLDSVEELTTGLHVAATIHVEKEGQRAILLGKGGQRIKEIGMRARERISTLAEQPVHLKLFVRVTERWRNMPRQLTELGYVDSTRQQ